MKAVRFVEPVPFRLLLALLVAASLTAPTVASAGVLDQQQPQSNPGFVVSIDLDESQAQWFTAGATGLLDQVDVMISTTDASAPLIVEIRAMAILPTDPVLASQQVPSAALTGVSGFRPVVFSAPAAVTAGTRYALVARSLVLGATESYEWVVGPAGDSYAGGGTFYADTSTPVEADWIGPFTTDLPFKTYVAAPPSSSQQPSSTTGTLSTAAPSGERAAALAKCKKKPKKKRKACRRRAQSLPE